MVAAAREKLERYRRELEALGGWDIMSHSAEDTARVIATTGPGPAKPVPVEHSLHRSVGWHRAVPADYQILGDVARGYRAR